MSIWVDFMGILIIYETRESTTFVDQKKTNFNPFDKVEFKRFNLTAQRTRNLMTSYQKINNSRVLVTGGAGFIGSNLCEDLLQNNNEVICLDNLVTGKMHNIQHLLTKPNFTFIEGDIRYLADCQKAMQGVNIVLQQAALGSVPRSIKDPIATNDINVSGFLNVLVSARDARVKRFVYASSSSVYGDSAELPKVEEVIGKPLSPYAVSKTINELYAAVFARNYGMEIIGLRYFNVFGKNQDPEGAYAAAIPKFIQLLIKHQSPEIHGNGTQSRDFTYIENVIQMNHLAATTSNQGALSHIYNTAVGERSDINALIRLLKKYLSKFDSKIADIGINYGSERQGDIPHSLASIEKAKTLLGYRPSHRFEDGLMECVDWYWNHLK